MWSLTYYCPSAPCYQIPLLLHFYFTYLAPEGIRVWNPRALVNHLQDIWVSGRHNQWNKEPSCLLSISASLHIQVLVDWISERKTDLNINGVPWLTFVILVLSATLCSFFFSSGLWSLSVGNTTFRGGSRFSLEGSVLSPLLESQTYSWEVLNTYKLQLCGFLCGCGVVFYTLPIVIGWHYGGGLHFVGKNVQRECGMSIEKVGSSQLEIYWDGLTRGSSWCLSIFSLFILPNVLS